MNRVQTKDTLFNSPALQPTARVYNIGGAATPAPRAQDNGIFALANALSDWHPVLNQLVAQRAASAQEAALTVGELKAAELTAQQRMDSINGQLKGFVDDGTVSKANLPSFQAGFARRTGRDIALTDYQTELDKNYKSTVLTTGERLDPQQFADTTLKALREKLPPGDIYAAKGFDEVASQLTTSFVQRSHAEYQKNYEAAAETKIANEGVSLLEQVHTSDPDTKDAALASVKNYYTGLSQTELPKHEVAPFFVRKSLTPLVEDLVSRGSYDDAEALVNDVESMDVTGQGGVLGNIASTKADLAKLKDHINERRRVGESATKAFTDRHTIQTAKGTYAADEALVKLNGADLTPEVKNQLVASFREANAKEPTAVRAFAESLDRAYTAGQMVTDHVVYGNIARLSDTTNTVELSKAQDALAQAVAARAISPADRLRLEDGINKRRTLYGLIAEDDVKAAERTIYRAEVDDLSRKVLPVFASAESYNSELLTPAQRLEHRQDTMQFYRDTLASKLRSGDFKSTEEAQAALPKLRAEATTEAIAFADRKTASLLLKPAQPTASPSPAPAAGDKPKRTGSPAPKTPPPPDPLKGVVDATATDGPKNNDRNRAAFLAFFGDIGKALNPTADWNPTNQGTWEQLKGNLTHVDPTKRDAVVAAAKDAHVYKAVKTDYYDLVKYRERGSDAGDPNYINRLRELAMNLKTHGGAEYLTPEQLTTLGINPAAFPTAGTKAGLIR